MLLWKQITIYNFILIANGYIVDGSSCMLWTIGCTSMPNIDGRESFASINQQIHSLNSPYHGVGCQLPPTQVFRWVKSAIPSIQYFAMASPLKTNGDKVFFQLATYASTFGCDNNHDFFTSLFLYFHIILQKRNKKQQPHRHWPELCFLGSGKPEVSTSMALIFSASSFMLASA